MADPRDTSPIFYLPCPLGSKWPKQPCPVFRTFPGAALSPYPPGLAPDHLPSWSALLAWATKGDGHCLGASCLHLLLLKSSHLSLPPAPISSPCLAPQLQTHLSNCLLEVGRHLTFQICCSVQISRQHEHSFSSRQLGALLCAALS